MKNNISIICSYHDQSKKYDMLKLLLNTISDDVYFINNNTHRSTQLQELLDKYGKYRGVQFDEFNAQSYFLENIQDDNEYVYNCHYRTFLDGINNNIELNPKTIYTGFNDFGNSIGHQYLMIWGHPIRVNNNLHKLYEIYSQIFDIPIEHVSHFGLFQLSNACELYICHKDVQKEMIESTYKFIELVCESFGEDVLNKKRVVGYMIEDFISFFWIVKEIKENYKIIPKSIIKIE